jgi:hypothetical protein
MDIRDTDGNGYTVVENGNFVEINLWEDEAGDSVPVRLPAEYKVCSVCRGKGTHVNPNIDRHGLSREDFDEDPDFREDYMNGRYDMVCNGCKGERVQAWPDWKRVDPALRARVEAHFEEEANYRAECEAERRMGA